MQLYSCSKIKTPVLLRMIFPAFFLGGGGSFQAIDGCLLDLWSLTLFNVVKDVSADHQVCYCVVQGGTCAEPHGCWL